MVRLERAQHRVDGLRADLVAALDQLDELVDDLTRLPDLRVVAVERQLIAAQADRAAETVAQRVEHALPHPRQLGRNRIGNIENFLHLNSV